MSPATIAFSICLAWRSESPPTQMSVNGFFSLFSPRALLSVRRPADAALCPSSHPPPPPPLLLCEVGCGWACPPALGASEVGRSPVLGW